MTYTFFDLLRDSFEREAHSVNYHQMNGQPAECFSALGKLEAYSDMLEAIGHTNEYYVESKESGQFHLPVVVKAIVDGKDLLNPGKEV